MPDRPLVSLQLDSGSLRKVLEYLLETVETSKQGLVALKGEYEADRKEIYAELERIPKMESDLAFCVETCENTQKLDVSTNQERVRNWGQKFLDMAEDQADIKAGFNAKMDKISEEISVGLKSGMEKLEEQVRDVTTRLTDFELAEFNRRQEALQALRTELNQRIHDLAIGLTVESEAGSEPSSPSRQNSILELGSSVMQSPRGDIGVLKDVKKYQNLHLRVLNLERRLASIGDGGSRKDQRKNSVLLPSDPASTHAIIDDFQHELHLRLITLFNETNSLKDTFRKISDKEDYLRDVDIPNFGNYVSYQKRILGLEERVDGYVKAADLETMVKGIIIGVRASDRKETAAAARAEAKSSPQLESVLSQLSELKQAVSDLQNPAPVFSAVPALILTSAQDSHSSTDRSPDRQLSLSSNQEHDSWQTAFASLQKAIGQRVTRSELDLVIKNKPPASPRDGASRAEKPDLKGKVDAMESKLTYYWDELNRVKTTLGEKSKAVDRLESLFAQANVSNESNLQRLRIELKSQIGDIHTLLDQQSEDPEALKNVTSLKVVVMKLQRDFRELAAGMEKNSRLEPPANATFEPESPIEDLQLSSSAPRDVPQLLKRHEAEIRHISSQISLLTDEINDLQLAAKRQSEASSQAYLRYMEDVKTEMEGILSKVNDGLKLSQRDFEKISELFEMVGSKGDRVDLEGKAGKEDLKRAAHLLAHRVRDM